MAHPGVALLRKNRARTENGARAFYGPTPGIPRLERAARIKQTN